MFAKQKKAVVFYERNYKTSHLQVQVIPVPAQAAPNLKDIFEVSTYKFVLPHLFSIRVFSFKHF